MAKIDPHSYTDSSQGRIAHLDLAIEVDFEASTMAGTARLRLAEPASGPLDLDTRDLDIRAVTDGAGASIPFELAERDSFMGQRLRLSIASPTDTIAIDYATSPDASALQWLDPPQTAGKKHPYMFSQCQAIHARSIIPVQDSPAVRFTFHAEITVAEPLTAVMGAAPGEKRAGDRAGTTIFAFEMPQAIPSYLFSIAVGNIASRDLGPRSRVYTEPEMLDAAAWEFASVDHMLKAAEDLFGEYLWDRFDFLVMPPSFPYGGMEHPRLTFLTPTLIAGDRSLVNVLAHELAHSWTGNLVTNASLNDFWLNEGFTVWAERRILEALEGPETMAMAAAIGLASLREDIEQFGADSPLTTLRNDLEGEDPDEVYSTIPYEKGCLFLYLLERTVGRERWDAFMRGYIDHFAFTSITTADFEAYIEEKLPGLLEKVGAAAWIDGPGLPDNSPIFESPRLEQLQAMAASYASGTPLDAGELQGFSADDWQVFLAALPKKIPTEACAWLDESFDLRGQGNAEILNGFLELGINSGYRPAYERAVEFLGAAGRMKYLKPLFRALHLNPETRELAAETYRRYADGYHPIARAGIERILAEATV